MNAARLFGSIAVVAVAAAAAPAAAQTSVATDTPLPAASELLARYHEAMGAATFANIQSLHSVGELAIPTAGITGTLEIWQGRPNRTVMHASVPNYGDVRTGFTGETGWSVDPMSGARLLTGAEAKQAHDDAHFDSHLRTSELIDSMTTVERTTLSGYECYKVRVVWKTGRTTQDCFAVDTGLLVGSIRTHHAQTGPAEALIIYEEYQQFGDLRLPTRITTRVGGVDQVITLRSVTLNDVQDSAFQAPPEIRELIGG
ncbi:MAG TPA: hypothetical protein VHG09_07575 [Longimicrobiales bacterium]|nr:hypothetical protein [Longimicrobiales bacterium]